MRLLAASGSGQPTRGALELVQLLQRVHLLQLGQPAVEAVGLVAVLLEVHGQRFGALFEGAEDDHRELAPEAAAHDFEQRRVRVHHSFEVQRKVPLEDFFGRKVHVDAELGANAFLDVRVRSRRQQEHLRPGRERLQVPHDQVRASVGSAEGGGVQRSALLRVRNEAEAVGEQRVGGAVVGGRQAGRVRLVDADHVDADHGGVLEVEGQEVRGEQLGRDEEQLHRGLGQQLQEVVALRVREPRVDGHRGHVQRGLLDLVWSAHPA